MNTMRQKRESCPECGEIERVISQSHPGTSFVQCDKCGFRGPEKIPQNTADLVWSAWNQKAKAIKKAALEVAVEILGETAEVNITPPGFGLPRASSVLCADSAKVLSAFINSELEYNIEGEVEESQVVGASEISVYLLHEVSNLRKMPSGKVINEIAAGRYADAAKTIENVFLCKDNA